MLLRVLGLSLEVQEVSREDRRPEAHEDTRLSEKEWAEDHGGDIAEPRLSQRLHPQSSPALKEDGGRRGLLETGERVGGVQLLNQIRENPPETLSQ